MTPSSYPRSGAFNQPRAIQIVRREPRHPGAQRSLFPSENFRYWVFLTDQHPGAKALLAIAHPR
ncbi:hypothetical protein [Candidatus Poriferisodalis sp.]|uniref:hypothetical protein n=1 Tax=Candidatus Poriferisodalis sp. TaxID=3101277 RepID=UPI003D145439